MKNLFFICCLFFSNFLLAFNQEGTLIIHATFLDGDCLACATEERINEDPDSIFNQVIHYGKTTSVNRDKVDWNKIEPEMQSIYKSTGLIDATKYMLKSLDDFHGRIWIDGVPHNGIVKKWVPSKMDMDDSILKAYQRGKIPIKGEVIDSEYGYIQVPGIGSGPQNGVRAKEIRQIIIDTEKNNKIKGWIVDLRLNGGGTMFPMLSGLSDFFEEGKEIGSFSDKARGYKDRWLIKDHNVYIEDWQVEDYKLSEMKGNPSLEFTPVVVLMSSATTSSGEVVAIAFKERAKTFFIGEDTGAYTTTVSSRYLADNIMLQVTESYYADRKENEYKATAVQPDEYMEGGDDFKNLSNDLKVKRAIEWINQIKK